MDTAAWVTVLTVFVTKIKFLEKLNFYLEVVESNSWLQAQQGRIIPHSSEPP